MIPVTTKLLYACSVFAFVAPIPGISSHISQLCWKEKSLNNVKRKKNRRNAEPFMHKSMPNHPRNFKCDSAMRDICCLWVTDEDNVFYHVDCPVYCVQLKKNQNNGKRDLTGHLRIAVKINIKESHVYW